MNEKSYQDLAELGENESARMDFLRQAVAAHKGTEAYRIAKDAEEYYAKKNITILRYQKVVMDATGRSVPDVWSANYKLTHGLFRQFVLQQVQYVMSNGVFFEDKHTKEQLGRNFDNVLQTLAKKAMVDGVSFGFWNHDHVDVFSFVDTAREPGFVPLYDADTGLLRAGIRYWSPSAKTDCWTLYEADGYTNYIQRQGENIMLLDDKGKQTYMQDVTSSDACGIESITGRNYPGFPIIPMYANDIRQSELVGVRASIDCYDFISSGMANTLDDTSVFYWTLSGTGGMDDVDLVQFVNRMKQLKAGVLGRGVEAEAHTITIPTEANEALLTRLKSDMYEDFMLLDTSKALSGDKTATAIRLAYQPQDDKCGDFEYCVRTFIAELFELLGIDDEPTFKWNRIANQSEETEMIMTASAVLDEETILRHLPWLTPEEVDDILKRKSAEEIGRFDGEQGVKEEEQPEEKE